MDDGDQKTAYKVEKVESKTEWIDITKECKLELFSFHDGFFRINIIHNGTKIFVIPSKTNRSIDYSSSGDKETFKIEYYYVNDFKILRRQKCK